MVNKIDRYSQDTLSFLRLQLVFLEANENQKINQSTNYEFENSYWNK